MSDEQKVLSIALAMEYTNGDVELLKVIVDMSFAQMDEDLPKLEVLMKKLSTPESEEVMAQTFIAIFEAAHRLKSSVATMGGEYAKEVFCRLESSAKSNDDRTCATIYTQMLVAVAELKSALSNLNEIHMENVL